MEHRQHISIEDATEHDEQCRGNCYYCRKLKRVGDVVKFINPSKGYAYDEVSVLL